VAQVDGHDRLDEADPLLGDVGERPHRDVLAAADAVQVGVLQADGLHADVGERPQVAEVPGQQVLGHPFLPAVDTIII
jgi:hypothetical protein